MAANIADLSAFIAVVRAGGFREAARTTEGSASSLSEAVRRLEMRLSVRLLNRSTRSIAPTEAGARLFERLVPALDDVEAALDVVNAFRDRPTGTLKLNVPSSVSRLVLPRIVVPFLKAFPDIRLEVIVEDGFVDVLAAGCDAGIRYDERLEQDMIAVPIGPRLQRFATAASPAYLDAHGRPDHPRDLATHQGLIYTNVASPNLWRFYHAQEGEYAVPVRGGLAANNGEVFLPALRAALGMAILPEFMVWRDLAEGALIEVLPEWRPRPVAISLVTPPGASRPSRVSVLLDHLAAGIKAARWARED